MTKAKIKINGSEYTFRGDDAKDALSKVKYSRVPFKLVRAIGIKWTRILLLPTFKNLNSKYDGRTSASLKLPKTLKSLLQKKTEGDLSASLDIELQTKNFSASAEGTFDSDGLNVSFESEINEANKTGNALKESLNLISNYNIDVNHITFEVDEVNSVPNASIGIDATVPKNLSQKPYRISG